MRVFYAPPFVDMHNRMKEALVLLGRIPAAHVRPPLTPVSASEREAIRQALIASGLLGSSNTPLLAIGKVTHGRDCDVTPGPNVNVRSASS